MSSGLSSVSVGSDACFSYGLCLAFSAFTMIMICVYVSVLAWENRRRARSNDVDDEKAKLRKGDLAADYRYMY